MFLMGYYSTIQIFLQDVRRNSADEIKSQCDNQAYHSTFRQYTKVYISGKLLLLFLSVTRLA